MSAPPAAARARARQRGLGLVTAIFLLVVIAGLAAALVTVSSAQQASSELDLQGVRAYQAARAGIEWGLFRQLRAGSCAGASSFALPADSLLAGFHVTVSCTRTPGPGGDAATATHLLRAVACNRLDAARACGATPANDLGYVQRVIEVQL